MANYLTFDQLLAEDDKKKKGTKPSQVAKEAVKTSSFDQLLKNNSFDGYKPTQDRVAKPPAPQVEQPKPAPQPSFLDKVKSGLSSFAESVGLKKKEINLPDTSKIPSNIQVDQAVQPTTVSRSSAKIISGGDNGNIFDNILNQIDPKITEAVGGSAKTVLQNYLRTDPGFVGNIARGVEGVKISNELIKKTEFGQQIATPEGRQVARQQATAEIDAVKRPIKADYKEPGLFGQMLEEFKLSTASLIGSVFGAEELTGTMTNNLLATAAGMKIRKEADKVIAANPEWQAPADQQWGKDKVGRLVAGAAPSLLGAIAAGVVTGPVGLFLFGAAGEGGSTYGEAIDAGTPEGKAQLYGMVVGAVNGTLEMIFPDGLLNKPLQAARKTITKEVASDLFAKVLKSGAKFTANGLKEGVPEVLQQLVSNSIAINYDKNRKPWDGLLESFVGGALSGGLAGHLEGKVFYPNQVREMRTEIIDKVPGVKEEIELQKAEGVDEEEAISIAIDKASVENPELVKSIVAKVVEKTTEKLPEVQLQVNEPIESTGTPDKKDQEPPTGGASVEVATQELRNYYAQADQEAVGQAHYEVFSELDASQAGTRTINESQVDGQGNALIATGTPSTFPDWIPDGFRTRKQIDEVLSGIRDLNNIEYPPSSQPKRQEFYDAILSEIDARAGVDSSSIRQKVIAAHEKAKLERTNGSSAKGSQGAKETAAKIEKPRTEAQKVKPKVTPTVENTGNEALLQEARKYKSAEEFIQAQFGRKVQFAKTDSLDVYETTINRKLVEDIKKQIQDGDFVGAMKHREAIGNAPAIRVEDGKVIDGNHRLIALKELGIKEAPIEVIGDTGNIRLTNKSQLTDIWNQANSKNTKTVENSVEKSKNTEAKIEEYISKRKVVKFREITDVDPLLEEARKYKSAEEFIKARTKPHYINIKDIKSSFDADTFSTLNGTPRNQNINLLNEYTSKIKKIEKSPVGREITKPISVEFNVGGGYRILDGNHRYLQALKNGDKRILVKFDTLKGTSQEGKNIFQEKTKSQLNDIWNQANSKNTKTVENSVEKSKNTEAKIKEYISKRKVVKFRENDEKNLIAQHNIKPQGVLHADKMGGLPLPSVAISRKEYPLEGFGEITLIAPPSLYDPAIRDNKVFNSDAYTPRYPSVTYITDSKKVKAALTPIIDDVKGYYKDSHFSPRYLESTYSVTSSMMDAIDFENNGRRALEDDFLLKGYFAKQKGAKPSDDITEIRPILEKYDSEYQEFIDGIFEQIAPDEKLFKGFTYSGNRRYQKHTLENVVKTMKSEMKDGEAFLYGVGNVRSKVAKKYTKLTQIKNDRNSIRSAASIEKLKTEFNDKWQSFIEKGTNEYKVGDSGSFTRVVIDGIKRKNLFAELKEYGYNTDIVPQLTQFLNEIKNAPSEYFEVKVQRSVGLDEFSGALVPNDTDQRVIKVLENNGLKIVKYDPKTETRQAKIEENFSREMFRVKDDVKQFTGKTITDAQEKQLIDLNKQIFGDDNVKITLQIMANRKALGSSKDGMITIVDGQANPKDTFYHEAVHKYIDVFTTKEEQIDLFKAGIEKYGTEDLSQVEEKIAEDFITYAKNREGVLGKIIKLFDKILSRIKLYLGNENKIESLYQEILKPATQKKAENKLTEEIVQARETSKDGSTKAEREDAAKAPVQETNSKPKLSRVAERVLDKLVGVKESDISYQPMNIVQDAARASEFVVQQPEAALRIAKGLEAPPADITETAISIAMAEQAREKGDWQLYTRLILSRTFRQTRRGQEIVAEKGRMDENSSEFFIRKLLDERARIVTQGKKWLFAKEAKLQAVIKREVTELKKTIDKKVIRKLESAQKLIDSITCKI